MTSFAEFAARLRESISHGVRVALPARVEAYDASKQKVAAQPLVRDYFEADSGALVTERLPVVSDVPVAFPSGGGCFLTLPITAGDMGLLVFADRSLDRWLNGIGSEVDPGDPRMHDLSDAIFLPGVYPFGAPRAGVSGAHVVMHLSGGAQLHLGQASPPYAVALAESVEDALSDLKSAMSSAANYDALKTALTTVMSAWPGSLGSASVKVKG